MSPGSYQYRAHGFTIESELELPEPAPFEGVADVLIRLGPVAAELEGPVKHGPGYQAAEGRYLLDVPRIARYLVTEGKDVRVAPAPGTSESSVRVFLLSSVMAAVAHQRGLLAMHASAVAVDGGAVLFAGDSGTGKSTLGAAFHDRGYPVVTDDISVIASDGDEHPTIHAGYRQVRLAADSLEHVGASLGARQEVDLAQQKYGLTVPGGLPDAAPHPANVHARAPAGRDDHAATAHRQRQGHGRRAGNLPATHVGRSRPALRALRAVRRGRPAHRDRRRRPPARSRALPRLVDALEDDLRGRR